MKSITRTILSAIVFSLFSTPLVSFTIAAEDKKAPASIKTAEKVNGKSLYLSSCATCHGVNGKGDGPVAPNLIKKPSDLTMLKKQNNGTFPIERTKKFIDGREVVSAHGSRDMPVWGNIFKLQAMEEGILQNDKSDLEQSITNKIDALLDYLNQIQTP